MHNVVEDSPKPLDKHIPSYRVPGFHSVNVMRTKAAVVVVACLLCAFAMLSDVVDGFKLMQRGENHRDTAVSVRRKRFIFVDESFHCKFVSCICYCDCLTTVCPSGVVLFVVAVVGCSTLLLAGLHCCWLVYTVVGCSTLLLAGLRCCGLVYAVVGWSTLLLAVLRCCGLFYTVVGCSILLLDVLYCCWMF